MRKSMKITPAVGKKMNTALDNLDAHAARAAEVWPTMTPAQRETFLAHSPVLARLLSMTEFARGDSWLP